MARKRTIFVKLAHPSGRVTTKKIVTSKKTLFGVQKEFLGTAEHERTEAFPIKIIKKPIKTIKRRTSRKPTGFSFRF